MTISMREKMKMMRMKIKILLGISRRRQGLRASPIIRVKFKSIYLLLL
jgi:hypothetical protein